MVEAATETAREIPHASGYPEPDWVIEARQAGYEWVGIAWQRCSALPNAWYDERKAEAVVKLWPEYFSLTEDRFAGRPYKLTQWQACIVRLVMGWKHPAEVVDDQTGKTVYHHVRVFRRVMLWVPRKNGKSEFLAALALMLFALDSVEAGQGFVFARDESQAKIIFDKMSAMVGYWPKKPNPFMVYRKSIWAPESRSRFELLTGKAEGKHGRSPTVIVGDEMHEWRTLDLATNLRQGTGARLEPIELYASTAGLKSDLIGYGLYEESLGIMDGRIDDPSTLVVMFAADPDDDWHDEEVWRRVNPSLGLSPTIAFLRREHALAIENPRAEAHFRRYHLNQWIEALVRWLNIKKWDACADDKDAWKTVAKDLIGRRCYGAFDVSSTQDITALIWLFPPERPDEKIKLVCLFWIPEETLEGRVKRDRVPYDKWRDEGALILTPGDYVDQSFVQSAIEYGLANYDVQNIAFDPWNARKLVGDLVNAGADDEIFVEMRQGIMSFAEPSKETERLVYSGQLDHGGHPVLRWMAQNTDVRFDENMNYMPAKKRSKEKIDGIVATVMSVGVAYCVKDDSQAIVLPDDYEIATL